MRFRRRHPHIEGWYHWLALVFLLALCWTSAGQPVAGDAAEDGGDAGEAGDERPTPSDAPSAHCALLEEDGFRQRMDGLLMKLLAQCGREDELGQVEGQESALRGPSDKLAAYSPEVQVNDSASDTSATTTQSETSLARSPTTGTLCSGFNDSNHFPNGDGLTGYARSVDGGTSFTDRGPLGDNSFGDPSLVWRRKDGNFYFAALEQIGLGIWRSTDDCRSFEFLGNTDTGADDKEILAVDNNPASPYYGRLYVGWTDFGAGGSIFANYSDDGLIWSAPVQLSAPGADVQGAWPAVAPNGDIYVGWVRWNPYPNGNIDIEIARSTDGGDNFTAVTNPLTGGVNPRNPASTTACGRPALQGNIRYLPSPQLAVDSEGILHVVYSYDPDGFGVGDTVNVYYRRSLNSGTTWGPEIQLNDDGTNNDQFFPTLSVGDDGTVVTTWYDRRLDPANQLIDYFKRTSLDGGVNWLRSVRLSAVSTPVYLDPGLAACYHGDYDQQIQTDTAALIQWADDRNVQNGHNDPDVFFSHGFDFSPVGSWTGAGYGSAPNGWYVGDFNGDQRDDIFRYMPGTSGADVFLSNGTQFVAAGSWTGAGFGSAPNGWYVGDFNGDQRDDIFRYMPGTSGADVFLSNGSQFVAAGSWTGAGFGSAPNGWYVGDFNGDQRDDIFRYMPGTSGADVFLSTGTQFVAAGSWTGAGFGSAPNGWYVGDFNGDQRDDIFRYLPGTSGADVFLSNGSQFVYAGSWTGAGFGSAPDGWFLGDFDGSGSVDIFRYLPGTSGADVFLANGGSFTYNGNWTLAGYGSAPKGWYVGDFNGDGSADIFRYMPGTSGAEVFLSSK